MLRWGWRGSRERIPAFRLATPIHAVFEHITADEDGNRQRDPLAGPERYRQALQAARGPRLPASEGDCGPLEVVGASCGLPARADSMSSTSKGTLQDKAKVRQRPPWARR